MHIVAILAAAGRGTRLGATVPKQLLPLGSRTILEWSLDAFLRNDRVDEIVVAVPAQIAADPPEWLRGGPKPVRIVAGGERRQDSVSRAFETVPVGADLVVVHDGARPFVSQRLISRVIDAACETGAAMAAVPACDTVKEALPDAGEPGTWISGRTLQRERIWLAQTPQAFRRQWLADAIARGREGEEATDEGALVERTGRPVRLVEGEPGNFKITSAEDLRRARAFVRRQEQATGQLRVGTGYDLHRFVAGRPLVIGGVTIPHDRGLAGHSDADALTHAIIDAILGAAGAGDIGGHFPDTDEQWVGASSLGLLRRATDIVGRAGFVVVNVDAVVIAERPRLAPYVPEIRRRLAHALRIDPSAVSVKGKTNEGVGELGRGEALAAHAVASVEATPGATGNE